MNTSKITGRIAITLLVVNLVVVYLVIQPVRLTHTIDSGSVKHESGFLYTYPGAEAFGFGHGDGQYNQTKSTLVLFEDGLSLGVGHNQHMLIRTEGSGAYSHWGSTLYFSASDNSNPRSNGHIYTIEYPLQVSKHHLALTLAALIGVVLLYALLTGGRKDAYLFLAGIFFTISFAEICVRLIFPIPGPGYGVWAGHPHSSLLLASRPDSFESVHRYNEKGFRGEGFSLTPTVSRIVAVGDSYTEGVGVKENEVWPARLERYLRDDEFEVINLGKAGANPETYVNIINDVGVALMPTDMIVAFNPVDLRSGPKLPNRLEVNKEFGDPMRENRVGLRKTLLPYFRGWIYIEDRIEGRWAIRRGLFWTPYDDSFFNRGVERLMSMSGYTENQAREIARNRLKRIPKHVLTAARERRFNPSLIEIALVRDYHGYDVTTADMGVSEEHLQEMVDDWIHWYSSINSRFGIRVWLLYFPMAPLVNQIGPWGPLAEEYYENAPKVFGDNSVREMLYNACKNSGVRFVDATDVLRANRNEELYLRYDSHPNRQAHDLVGKLVFETFRDSRLLIQ